MANPDRYKIVNLTSGDSFDKIVWGSTDYSNSIGSWLHDLKDKFKATIKITRKNVKADH